MPTLHLVDEISRTRSRLAAWKFGQLAVFFLLLLFLLPLLHHSLLVKAISTLFVLNSMLVADSSNPNAHGLLRLGWSLWGIALASNVIEEFHVSEALTFAMKYLAIGSHALLLLVCAVSILNVVFRASRITLDGIIASIVAYELIGLLFAQIYTLAYVADSTSLQLPGNATPSTENFQVELIYYSFVTLATLGYGDIVPVTNVTRSVAIVEAVIGQFYVAVIVAVLVSAFVSQRIQDQAESSGESS